MKNKSLIDRILTEPTELSEEQRKAVLTQKRHVRVIAAAGTGKTETITRRIAYLLLVQGVQPSEVVAFTFTEKAAQSMKDRIYGSVSRLSGPSLTARLGEMYIGTIHGYAMRLLQDAYGYGNYTVLDENQEMAFILRQGWSLDISKYGSNYAEACSNFLRTVNMAWDEILDPDELKRHAPEFHACMTKYQEHLDDHKLLTFGRMTHLAAVRVKERPDFLSRVKHLLVDEYQDINRAQEVLIEAIGKKASVFVVGDPRQCIYQWRGSDEQFFWNFSRRFKDASDTLITRNRRSAGRIVKNANSFAATLGHKYKAMQAVRTEEGFVGVAQLADPDEEAMWIADQIEKIVRESNVSYADVGVLMRSVSTSAGPLLGELRRRRIPFIVGGKVGLFRRDEAQALGRIFAWFNEDGFWVEDPWKWHDKVTGDDLLATGLGCWSQAVGARMPSDARNGLLRIKEDVHGKKSQYDNFTEIYRDVLKTLGFHDLNFSNRNDAAIMASLGRFSEMLTDYETANRLGGRSPIWHRDLMGLCWFMNSYAIRSYDQPDVESFKGIDAVHVTTVHQAKGLEWPVVFLISMTSGRFPSRMVGRPQSWCDVPTNMFDVTRYQGSDKDERRLFYVAITRARDVLVLSYFERLRNSVNPSVYIDDMNSKDAALIKNAHSLPKIGIKKRLEREELQLFSAADILTYRRCPYLYLLGTVWGFQPGLNPRLGFGRSLHHCLKCASELVKLGENSPEEAVVLAVSKEFHMPFMGGDVLNEFKDNAMRRLLYFAKIRSEDFGKIEEMEYRLEFPVERATISGRVDVILRESDDLEVREYKTSEEARSFEESSTQVRLYTLGLRGLGRSVASGSIAYLEGAEIRQVEVGADSVESAKSDAESAVSAILSRNFKPRLGEQCGKCDQGPLCRWHVT